MNTQPCPGVRQGTPLSERLARLAALQATDAGTFVLAVHSFVEGVMRESLALDDEDDDRFRALLERYADYCRRKLGGTHPAMEVLKLLDAGHRPTNAVRHYFAAVEVNRAREATQHLRRFCQLAGIDCPVEQRRLEGYLSAWEERTPHGALVEELGTIRKALGAMGGTASSLLERIGALERAEREVGHFREELKAKDRRIEELSRRAAEKDGKVDSLRKERAQLVQELKAEREHLASELEEAVAKVRAEADAQAYLEAKRAALTYTRTRADYERSLVRLTPEQIGVLRQIRLDKDFLVKGAAGTGKTLVLLEAIRKAKGRGLQSELGMEELRGAIALVTYTRALTKYDRYLAGLLDVDAGDRIQTALSFIAERFRILVPGAKVVLKLSEEAAAPFCPSWMTVREFVAEADNFIWANMVTEEEYVAESFPRHGMRKSLHVRQREALWSGMVALEEDLKAKRVYSQNHAARDLVLAMRAGVELERVDYVFVDETQDLSAAMLAAMKSSSRRALILAGDGDQSIYQPFTSFERAGIDIIGRSRVLRTNFRNTVQLHAYAERYRVLGRAAGLAIDEESQPIAFREGPEPELYEAADSASLLELLITQVGLYVGRNGYDPENIAILAPTKKNLESVAEALEARGFASAIVPDDQFEFQSRGQIRLCTLHSAKGLDFPVVFLWIPSLHVADQSWGDVEDDRIHRNLLYVGLTRAMDHCMVFLKEGLTTPAVRDLVHARE